MSPNQKIWGILASLASLIAIFTFLFNLNETKDSAWRLFKADLMEENADLKKENEGLRRSIAGLKRKNESLTTYIDAYENNIIELKDAARNGNQNQSILPIDLPEQLTKERFEIRQIYRQMIGEKKRWDQYQQDQYKTILESVIEPAVIESQGLYLDVEENIDYFLELENALKLHKRLIRDVRLFHDEIQFQKKQLDAQRQYELYDLKFRLAPFARESALVDALQQALSALSAGIYQQEAVGVLDRIGDAFTKPIQQIHDQQLDTAESLISSHYNYNLYTVFGKKLIDYTDALAQQSSIVLGPSAFGELDFFNRRLYESLYDLYQVGQDEAINPTDLNLNELEQVLDSRP